jgi:glycerol kinase
MGQGAILAIDQGTTNTKAVLVDPGGLITAQGARPLTARFPHAAWVELDAVEVWQSVVEAASACLAAAQGTPRLAAVALTNQRESVVVWERATGRPLGPVVVWQCRRTAPACESLRTRGLGPLIKERTGLDVDPLFSATKMHWLLDRIPDGAARAAAGDLCAGTVDAWVLWNLTGGSVFATDASNASRTQLFSLRTGAWDPELAAIFSVPVEVLPDVRPSNATFGETVRAGAIPAGVPIAAVIADSHAALYGQAGFRQGTLKVTFGTGSSLMAASGSSPLVSARGISTTVAWRRGVATTFALEGNISVTGAAIDWAGQLLFGAEGFAHAERLATLAAAAPDTLGVYLVPAFVGLGAPHWDDRARGVLAGLTRGVTAAHVARAALESIAYQVRDVFDAMEADTGVHHDVVLADGGPSRNDQLMQFQSDILARPVARARSTDLSALGAAYLAGETVGLWSSQDEVASLPRERDRFEPMMPEAERARLCLGWQDAVARARR